MTKIKYITFPEHGVLNVVCTGWLQIKYPTRQYAISLQPAVRF